MLELAPTGAMHAWRARHSFVDVWRSDHWDRDGRERTLRFWLRAAEHDDWTFQELRRLIGWMIDEGQPVPAALQAWANEVAAGRRSEPTRTGPKTDHCRDYQMLFGATIMELLGWSRRRAYGKLGEIYHCSPQAARDAVKRASKWPPGAWSGIPQK